MPKFAAKPELAGAMKTISPTTITFIRAHRSDDVRELMLQAHRYPEVDMRQACVQISAWQMARTKLPLWAETEDILFPEHLSMEQCSSQATAEYKGRVIQSMELRGKKYNLPSLAERGKGENPFLLCDLTGGFGVDATLLALAYPDTRLTFVERNPELCNLAHHNLPLLGVKEAEVVCGEAEAVLQTLPHQHLIYIDPARRDSHGGKTVAIEDCTPNILQLNDLLLERADYVMVKLSPMLDIRLALRQLRGITDVHVVSLQGECKEVLMMMCAEESEMEPRIHCVNLPASSFSFTYGEEQDACCPFTSSIQRYLYEPNASVMKAAPFKVLAQRFGLQKLHPSSHLYTSDRLCADFPGRQFEVVGQSAFNKKELKAFLSHLPQANLTVRNFPLTVAELRRRLHLSEGGTDYLFATTLSDERHVLIQCRKTL